VDRWRALLREHGIEPADESARTAGAEGRGRLALGPHAAARPPPAEPASDGELAVAGSAPVEAGPFRRQIPAREAGPGHLLHIFSQCIAAECIL